MVKITRVEGDTLVYNKLKTGFLLTYCSSIIKGLPKWARKLQEADEKKESVTQSDDKQKSDTVQQDDAKYTENLKDALKDNVDGLVVC